MKVGKDAWTAWQIDFTPLTQFFPLKDCDLRAALGTAQGMPLSWPASVNRTHPPNFSENGPQLGTTLRPLLGWVEGPIYSSELT